MPSAGVNERTALADVLERVRDGFTVVLIEGEAGIGKTTLLSEAIDLGRARGMRILTARPTQAEEHLAFTGLSDLLEPVADHILQELPPPQREALETAMLLRAAQGRSPDPRTVGAATLSALRALASDAPVIVAIDDLQWLDAPSSAALTFAFRRLADAPAVAILTRRAEPGSLPPPLALDPSAVDLVSIPALSEDEVRALLASRLGYEPSRGTLRRIVDVSAGNPLFALELGRALRGRGELPEGEPLPVPQRLRDLVLSRLRDLPPQHRAVLLHAAVLREPTIGLLNASVGGAVDIEEALDAAEEASFVVVRDGRVTFAHPLFASVLYGSTRAAARRSVHAKAARAVSDPEERARHLALASSGPDEETAAALEAAAARARARGAASTAAQLASLAEKLTPAALSAHGSRRALLAGGYHMDAQQPEEARASLSAVASSDASAEMRAEALVLLARIAVREHGPSAGIETIRESLAILGDRPTPLRARALSFLASASFTGPVPNAEAIAAATEATEVARRSGDGPTESLAKLFQLFAKVIGGYEIDREVLDQIPRPESRAPTLYFAGSLFMNLGEHARARALLEELRGLQAQVGDEFDHPVTTVILAELEWREGNLARSAELAQEALNLTLEGAQTAMAPWSASHIAMHRAAIGDALGARALMREWLPVAKGADGPPLLALTARGAAFVELTADDPAAAVAILEPIWAMAESLGEVEHAALPFRSELIEGLIRSGDLARAEDILTIVEARQSSYNAFTRQCWLRCREQLAAARDDVDAALQAGEEAVALAETLPMPLERARTLLSHGIVLRRAKQKRKARELLERAEAMFSSIGASTWAGRLRPSSNVWACVQGLRPR